MKSFSIALVVITASVSAQFHPDYQHPIAAPARASISFPLLGFGTWNIPEAHDNASDAVSHAIKTGYRHIDCAAAYRNEKNVGKGIAKGLEVAGLGRQDIWVTSKLWNDHHQPDMVEKGLDQTLSDLGLDYLDLYLMHWPVASTPSGKSTLSYVDTWNAMTALLATGKTRHIGISNFSPAQLARLLSSTTTPPFAHQMELHPYLQQPEWIQYHAAHSIHVTAYSPLGNSNPTYGKHPTKPVPLLENPVLTSIATKRNCTSAQVALAWGMSRGTSVIPKSTHAGRIAENYGSLECELAYEDLKQVGDLGRAVVKRFNNPSGSWGVDLYEGLDGA